MFKMIAVCSLCAAGATLLFQSQSRQQTQLMTSVATAMPSLVELHALAHSDTLRDETIKEPF